MLTRLKKGEIQSTLKYKSKTHSGVLPQLRTLEVPVDVSGKVKPGTTGTGPTLPDHAGFQHGRGEPRMHSGSPSPQGEEKSGVTRVFVLCRALGRARRELIQPANKAILPAAKAVGFLA